jgi:hypothetical protein
MNLATVVSGCKNEATNMKSDFVSQLLTFLSGGGAVAAARWLWKRLFNIKKETAEAEGLSIDNAQAAANMWKELVQELKGSLDRQDAQVNRLSQQCKWLEGELATVLKENETLRARLRELEAKNLYQ